MSYILDALRKAEAERERGNVPGVHAQPMFPASATGSTPGQRPPAWMLPAAIAVLLLAGAGVWYGVTRSSSPADAPSTAGPQGRATPAPFTPPPATQAPTPVAAVPAVPALVPPPPTARADVSAVSPPPTRSLDSIVAALPKPPVPVPLSSTPLSNGPSQSQSQSQLQPQLQPQSQSQSSPDLRGSSATAPAGPRIPAPALATNLASANTGPSDTRIYALHELPDDIRRQLPTLAVGGSMYSPTPANRLLIVNGQVLHEGDRITPELALQQIKVKAAVLTYKGYRYTINY